MERAVEGEGSLGNSREGRGVLCPRDRSGLVGTQLLGLTIDTCAVCTGSFLDRGELALVHGLREDLAGGGGLETEDPRGPATCPKCGSTMDTRWFSENRKVQLDRCPSCEGIWLDAKELRDILVEAYRMREDED